MLRTECMKASRCIPFTTLHAHHIVRLGAKAHAPLTGHAQTSYAWDFSPSSYLLHSCRLHAGSAGRSRLPAGHGNWWWEVHHLPSATSGCGQCGNRHLPTHFPDGGSGRGPTGKHGKLAIHAGIQHLLHKQQQTPRLLKPDRPLLQPSPCLGWALARGMSRTRSHMLPTPLAMLHRHVASQPPSWAARRAAARSKRTHGPASTTLCTSHQS